MSELETIADRLSALGNPTRLQIYRLLVRAGSEGMSVGRIQEILTVPGSTLSHHLKLLDTVGLIAREKQGTTLICLARYDIMDTVIGFLADECCADADQSNTVGWTEWKKTPRPANASNKTIRDPLEK